MQLDTAQFEIAQVYTSVANNHNSFSKFFCEIQSHSKNVKIKRILLEIILDLFFDDVTVTFKKYFVYLSFQISIIVEVYSLITHQWRKMDMKFSTATVNHITLLFFASFLSFPRKMFRNLSSSTFLIVILLLCLCAFSS